jgi:hypothetical protein
MTYKLFLETQPGLVSEKNGLPWASAMQEVFDYFPEAEFFGSDFEGRFRVVWFEEEVGELITENEAGREVLRERN